MKTTSFEISKKLAEIGFTKAGSDRGYDKDGICCLMANFPKEIEYIAYDLETILDALPKSIQGEDDEYHIIIGAYYGGWRVAYSVKYRNLLVVVSEFGESLADTTARLLILLHEKGIINFNN